VLSLAAHPPPRITRTTEAIYNPLLAGRRCGHCNARDRWVRLEFGPVPGGWICACSDLPEIKHDPRELRHVCTFACAIGGAA
jgi:hypothetical protein